MSTIENNIKIIRKNIKHTYIRVKDGNIIVTTNFLTPKIYIDSLIKSNINNIEKMLIRDSKLQEQDKDFYLFGKKYEVIYKEDTDEVFIQNNYLIAKDTKQLNDFIDSIIKTTYSKRLTYWYNKIEESIPIPKLKIRKMKTRWGVCNRRNNNITLNYYLYKYDLYCLDYVIVHELVHFIIGNHSKEFWSYVEKYYPNYKIIRKKLK